MRVEGGAIVVRRVLAPGPLRVGDSLAAIDGAPIGSLDVLAEALRRAASREHVRVGVTRDGASIELVVPVVPMPAERVDGATVRYGQLHWRGHRVRTIEVAPDAAIATVLFLQGIYCQSIDLALSPDAPLARLVRELAARGVATLRVERPGTGDSEGPPCGELDLHGEIELYAAALDALGAPPILFGHSLGGAIAPMLAHRSLGVVAYGAPGEPWARTMRDGIERQLRLRGADEARIAAALARFDADPWAEGHGRSPALHRQLDALDFADLWSRVRVPVLVIVGEHDWVTGERAQLAIAEHARNARVLRLSGLDHSFTTHASLEASLREHGRGAFDVRVAEATAAFARAIAGP